ncbi:MAG: fibrinogen-like YCDxxxxGGGW domain-containing protein [Nannocystaceae bacterium]
MSACLQLNPAYDAGTDGGTGSSTAATSEATSEATTLEIHNTDDLTSDAGSESGTAGTTSDSDSPTTAGSDTSEAEAEVESESESETETETETGSENDLCGNGAVDPDEDCDDNNKELNDGCLPNCIIPETCAQILEHANDAESGTYLVDPANSGEPWSVICDMELDGGGWTGFVVEDTCNGHLSSSVNPLVPGESEGVDDKCRPYSSHSDGAFAYHWDISFPPAFDEFFLRDFETKSIGTPELNFPVSQWGQLYDFPKGSLSFGSAYNESPDANWILDGGTSEPFEADEVRSYPVLDVPASVGETSDMLRISWGEYGIELEGLYPWWSGRIFVR